MGRVNFRLKFLAVLLLCLLAPVVAQAESGIASSYCDPQTSLGKMDCGALTAAHRTLPFHTKVLVFNRHNRRWVVVTITDRGLLCLACSSEQRLRIAKRVIDLTPAASKALGSTGLAPVIVVPLLKSRLWI